MKNKNFSSLNGTATSILAAAILSLSNPAIAAIPTERCADIVKEGKNACEANGHSCAAQSTYDNQPDEWIKVPEGTCLTIVSLCNGDMERPEGVSKKKMRKVCRKVADQEDDMITGGRLLDLDEEEEDTSDS